MSSLFKDSANAGLFSQSLSAFSSLIVKYNQSYLGLIHTVRTTTVAFVIAIFFPSALQAAIVIDEIQIGVSERRQGGVVIGWGFSTNVIGSGVKSGTVTPAGKSTHNLTKEDDDSTLDMDASDNIFTSLALLEASFPDNVTYAYSITGVGGDTLDFSVSLNMPVFPTGFPDIINPNHLANDVPLNALLEWECQACTGDHIDAAVEGDNDFEVKHLYDPVGSGSLNPGVLDPGTTYVASVTLVGEIFIEDGLDLGAYGMADLRFNRSVDNEITFSTAVVPIPAALPLLLSGLIGLGWLGGARRKS
jgi:hypothetical protein